MRLALFLQWEISGVSGRPEVRLWTDDRNNSMGNYDLVISSCLDESTKTYKDNHNAELQRADPGTKVRGNSVRGRILPHDAQNGFSLFSPF